MKKTYINPIATLINVSPDAPLLQTGSAQGTKVLEENATANEEVLSRQQGHALWDDEDIEEDF